MKIFITGGASGLGEAITRKMAVDASCEVFFTYSSSADRANTITSEFSNTRSLKCDFKNQEEVRQLKSSISELNPDVLINNAYTGTFIDTHFHKTAPEDFVDSFKNNVVPVIEITQAALLGFRKKKFGRIITVLSSALLNTPPMGTSVYVANKAYVEMLSKMWAVENAKFNITSNTISPDFMMTSFTQDIDERIVEQIKEKNPLKTILTVEEVADSIHFLVHSSPHLNGINLIMNAALNLK